MDPLLREAIYAIIAITALEAVISLIYWLATGLSPWPFLILAQTGAFGSGVALLVIALPHHRE